MANGEDESQNPRRRPRRLIRWNPMEDERNAKGPVNVYPTVRSVPRRRNPLFPSLEDDDERYYDN